MSEKLCSYVLWDSKPGFVLNFFLIFCQNNDFCSYKIVLLKPILKTSKNHTDHTCPIIFNFYFFIFTLLFSCFTLVELALIFTALGWRVMLLPMQILSKNFDFEAYNLLNEQKNKYDR